MKSLEKKYQNKILFKCQFKGGSDLYHHDIKDEDFLMFYLYDVFSNEYRITDDGIAYIKERFGLNRIYERIKQSQVEGVDWDFKNKQQFEKWIHGEPYGPIIEEETIKVKDGSHFTVVRFKRRRA